MPDRIIFHADCNNFFASCECLERPELKDVPMAVAGDPENRVGVVVAKNELAKKYGVKTTDTVYAARKKCPGIVFVPPRHRYYGEISRRVNAIYCEYTEYVEPASIDESYLDVTQALPFYGMTPEALADELRRRIRQEIGITISVGVSFCKIFAKMGSDYRKLVDAEAATEQLTLFDLMGQGASRQKRERLEAAVEDLRKKYGDGSVTLGIQENADIGLRRRK